MFSIIIPTLNNLSYLKLCIESIQKNSKYNHEIIPHVNVGTDGTLEYLVNTSDSYNKFKNFSDNIHKLLLPGGKWFTATIHFSNQFMKNKKRILKSHLWPDLIKFY